jgi:ferredoxin-like protein FixX
MQVSIVVMPTPLQLYRLYHVSLLSMDVAVCKQVLCSGAQFWCRVRCEVSTQAIWSYPGGVRRPHRDLSR